MKSKISAIIILLGAQLLLSACGLAKTPTPPKPTPSAPTTELILDAKDVPIINLTPRQDGHELTMKLTNIPLIINQIEYELLYTVSDNGNEIEKGLGDTIKIANKETVIERKLLLGTASCTNGCKYKYDEGINGGTLTITLFTANNQVTTLESPFSLISAATFKKDGSISLKSEGFSVKAKPSSTDFFILLKNQQKGFSIFSSAAGKGTVSQITPQTLSKSDKTTIAGDYLPSQ